jgi:hypothetical protein
MIKYLSDREPERMRRKGMVQVAEAAAALRSAPPSGIEFMEFLRAGGSGDCPTCDRYASIYKRGLNKSMAYGLVAFSRQFQVGEWVDVPEWKAGVGLWQSNDAAQLRHWGLLESQASVVKRSNMAEDSPDHSTVGIWRLTPKGLEFARGELSVPRFVVLYNQKSLGLVGEEIYIDEVQGFSFDDLTVSKLHLASLSGESVASSV